MGDGNTRLLLTKKGLFIVSDQIQEWNSPTSNPLATDIVNGGPGDVQKSFKGSKRRNFGGKRDADAAKKLAEERLRQAQDAAKAVDAFYDAADRMDKATADLEVASKDRQQAVQKLRLCGLTNADIVRLTGLSASRVQVLAQEPSKE